jgi:hypothetical protein
VLQLVARSFPQLVKCRTLLFFVFCRRIAPWASCGTAEALETLSAAYTAPGNVANSGYVGGCRVNNTETGQYADGRNGLLVPDYSGKIADESKFTMGGWFYKTVSVQLFAPSTLDWRERGVKLA